MSILHEINNVNVTENKSFISVHTGVIVKLISLLLSSLFALVSQQHVKHNKY